MSEAYDPDNLLDRHTDQATLQVHYDQLMRRERELLDRRLPLRGGRVLAIGCGWHPGRHLFPSPEFRITAVDVNSDMVRDVVARGEADDGFPGRAGELDRVEPESYDVVLYRLVLHHIAYQGPLAPCFTEAARALAPGGALVAIEPNLWHPVGAALALANRVGAGEWMHGTEDDIPLSPRRLVAESHKVRLEPEIHAVTYSWRRMPERLQNAVHRLDAAGSSPGLAALGHTMMLVARKPREGGGAREPL